MFWKKKKGKPFEATVRINTPKGKAKYAALHLKPLIIGLKKCEYWVNKDNSQLTWRLRCNSRQLKRMTQLSYMYDVAIKKIFSSKVVRNKILKSKDKEVSEENLKELEKLLKYETKIDVKTKLVEDEGVLDEK
jgi:hypothetical protein